MRSDSQNVRRMTTAIRLNQVIRQQSTDAKLIIVNMPKPPKDEDGEKSCILWKSLFYHTENKSELVLGAQLMR